MHNRQALLTAFGDATRINVTTTRTLPTPNTYEVRIRVEASSMVFTDTVIRKGIYPYLDSEPPFTLGYDFVGIIDEVGEGVTDFHIGDRVADVTKIGSNADYVIRTSHSLIHVPQHLDPIKVETFLLSGMTAYQMLHRIAKVQRGQRILVQGGTGAVGNALVQLAKAFDLEVVATAAANNISLLEAYDVTAIDYRSPNLNQELQDVAANGFHAAFDGVGMVSFRRSFSLLADGGVLIPYGFVSAARTVERKTDVGSLIGGVMFASSIAQFKVWNMLPNSRSVSPNYDLVSYRQAHPQAYRDDMKQMFRLLEEGQINPLIHQTFPLDDIQQAHATLDKGGVRGRIVITHS